MSKIKNAVMITFEFKKEHVPIPAKYPLPQGYQNLRKQFLETSDRFTNNNRGKVFN